MIVTTWNVNGVRAREAALTAWLHTQKPDVLCLQEIKATTDDVPEPLRSHPDYVALWHGCTMKKGYSGVATLVRKSLPEPTFDVPAFDDEARIVQAVFGKAVVINVYVPRGEKDEPSYAFKLKFLADLARHVQTLKAQGKQVILCGDFNVCHTNMDVHPSYVKGDLAKVTGLKPDERKSIDGLAAAGVQDVFRVLNPNENNIFSWWPYWRGAREKNLGQRLDYIFATPILTKLASACTIATSETSSDHSPVTATFNAAL